jgi:hypothetical protein
MPFFSGDGALVAAGEALIAGGGAVEAGTGAGVGVDVVGVGVGDSTALGFWVDGSGLRSSVAFAPPPRRRTSRVLAVLSCASARACSAASGKRPSGSLLSPRSITCFSPAGSQGAVSVSGTGGAVLTRTTSSS